MNFAGKLAVAGAVGLLGTAAGADDVAWRKGGDSPPPPPAVKIVPPEPPKPPAAFVKPKPQPVGPVAVTAGWRSAVTPAAFTARDPQWRAATTAPAVGPWVGVTPAGLKSFTAPQSQPLPTPRVIIPSPAVPAPIPIPTPVPDSDPPPRRPMVTVEPPPEPRPRPTVTVEPERKPSPSAVETPPPPVEIPESLGRRAADDPAADGPEWLTRFYSKTDYLYWWTRRGGTPVLATTATAGGFGYLGSADTRTLLGAGDLGTSGRSGFRVRGGWSPDGLPWGLEAGLFFLGRRADGVSFSGDQYPTLARPVFAPNFGREYAELTAYPGFSAGTFQARLTSSLWGGDVAIRRTFRPGAEIAFSPFVGYRHLNLGEELRVRESETAGPTNPFPTGTRLDIEDRFRAASRFHGGQAGFSGSWRWGRTTLDARGAVSLGVTRQTLDVAGETLRTLPGGTAERLTGGLFAAGPALGHFTRNRFSAVPELGLALGFDITPTLKATFGYDVLYWSGVMRPGEQVDRTVDLTNVPVGPAVAAADPGRPRPTLKSSDFWAQGLQVGITWVW